MGYFVLVDHHTLVADYRLLELVEI